MNGEQEDTNIDSAVIIGNGMVGNATAKALTITKFFDTDAEKSNVSLKEAANCRYIFICLPTPTTKNGDCFTTDIIEMVRQIVAFNETENIFIIRSTVTPGFASTLKQEFGIIVVSNPEFLSEDTWQDDVKNPSLIVVGADYAKYREEVAAIYKGRYPRIKPILTDTKTAELLKYALNTFFAMKVIYANEIFNTAERLGANYETIKDVLEKHPWGSKNHLQIWYKEHRGVGGHCLPKDLKAFATYSGSTLFKILEALHDTY